MINIDHYNECKHDFMQLVQEYVPKCNRDITSKSHWTKKGDISYETYDEGFNPEDYRRGLLNEILSSNSFIKLSDKLTKESKCVFTLFGNYFCINPNDRLRHIFSLSLIMYNVNMNDLCKFLEKEFKDLYFCIHENKFEIKIKTALLNLDAVEGELLSQNTLKVYFKKMNKIILP